MGLNIKNDSVHALVRELAARTGTSQTSAVEDAVRRRLSALEQENAGTGPAEAQRSQRLADIVQIAADIRLDYDDGDLARLAARDHALYGGAGLPG